MSPRCRCVASCIFLVLQANCSWKGHVCLSEVYHCCTFFQDESDVFFHLARFAAVGSCCCIAFRAKFYTGSGIIVRVFDQVMMFSFFTDSTTFYSVFLGILGRKTCFPMIYSAFSSSFLRPGLNEKHPK